MIDKFRDGNRFLSNFWPIDIEYEGLNYSSVEHAYQASKTTDLNHRKFISKLGKPGDAKRFGNKVKLIKGWDRIKIIVMEELLRKKFSNKELRDRLLKTGDEYLEEGNTWHDNFWGVCKCNRCYSKEGLNNLGKLLMKIRQDLQNKRDMKS